jgi:hypothetical protein
LLSLEDVVGHRNEILLAERPLVAIVAALLWFAGVLLFLVQLVRQAFRPAAAA